MIKYIAKCKPKHTGEHGDASLGPVDYTHNTVTGGVDFAGTVYPEQIIFIVYAL